jgi:coenzyme F420-reducing hydrogenase delta subunit
VERVQQLLAQIGLEPQRVKMFNISSAMAGQFAALAKEMSDQIVALGPNPLKADGIESMP